MKLSPTLPFLSPCLPVSVSLSQTHSDELSRIPPRQVKPYVQYKERRANWNGPGYNMVKSSVDEDLSVSHLDVEDLPLPPPPPPRAPSPPPGPTALEQAAAIASGGPIEAVGGGGGKQRKRKGSKSAQNSPGGGMHKGDQFRSLL